jgi:hypothetical protein
VAVKVKLEPKVAVEALVVTVTIGVSLVIAILKAAEGPAVV